MNASLLAALVFLRAAAPVATPMASAQLHVVDVMPAFWAVWDETAGKPIAERVDRFRKDVVDPNETVYGLSEFDHILASDERLARYLQSLEPYAAPMRDVSTRIEQQLPSLAGSVTSALPGLSTDRIVVYLLPSLDHFIGQTHDLPDGRIAVMFGIDKTARLEGADANLGVEVAHELFHIYQFETHPGERSDQQALWQWIWIEGSAAYASLVLTPGSTEAQALSPELAQATAATIGALACGIESKWDSHDGDDLRAYLDAGEHPPNLPPMGGYLIGYLIAQDLAKTYSLAEIGQLAGTQRARLVNASVRRLCSV
jgi:Predicted Zn-dependent protease (DUF2268)